MIIQDNCFYFRNKIWYSDEFYLFIFNENKVGIIMKYQIKYDNKQTFFRFSLLILGKIILMNVWELW